MEEWGGKIGNGQRKNRNSTKFYKGPLEHKIIDAYIGLTWVSDAYLSFKIPENRMEAPILESRNLNE